MTKEELIAFSNSIRDRELKIHQPRLDLNFIEGTIGSIKAKTLEHVTALTDDKDKLIYTNDKKRHFAMSELLAGDAEFQELISESIELGEFIHTEAIEASNARRIFEVEKIHFSKE